MKEVPQRPSLVAAIARELACRATRSSGKTRGWRTHRSHPRRGRDAPSKMDRWAPLVDQWLRRLQGEQEAERTRRTGSAPARRRVRRRRLRADRQALVREAARPSRGGLGRFLDLDWPGGGRAGRLRPRGVRREGSTRRDALLRRELPASNVGSPRCSRRERGACAGNVNVPEFVGGVPTRSADNATGFAGRGATGPHHQALRYRSAHTGSSTGSGTPTPDTRRPWRTRSGRRGGNSSSRSRGVGRRRANERSGEVAPTCRARSTTGRGGLRARAT